MPTQSQIRYLCLLVVCALGLALFAGTSAAAEDRTIGGAVDAWGNYVTIGVIAHITGDDNDDGSAKVWYRAQGQSTWLEGHPLYRMDATRYAGSIFYLEAGTTYEVDVELIDPDGVLSDPAAFNISTKSETVPQGSGADVYVSPTGDDDGAGTQADPYATIGKAHSVSLPGDTVHVLPGTYRESVTITRSGTSNAYITYVAEGTGVILDSSDPVFLDATEDWTQDSGNVYYADYTGTTSYVAADGERLYPRSRVNDLKNPRNGVDGGFCLKSGKLYVSIPDSGGDPDNHTMNVATLGVGFTVQADYIVIDGFEVRYFGVDDYQKGIFIDAASDNVIRNNTIHNCGTGVWIRNTSSDNNLISNNEIYDTGVFSWPWEAVKDTEMEEACVFVEGGWGTVVRNNTVHGSFDAIGPSVWSYPNDEAYNGEVDIYNNEMYDILDDGLEPEGTCINLRVFDNDMTDVHMGISIAPITLGPAYFIRNTVYQWANTATQQASAIKLSSSTAGRVYLYHNTFCTTAADQNGIEPSGDWENLILRNNILYASWYAIEDYYDGGAPTSDWDYDDIYTTYDNPGDPRYVKWANVRYATLSAWQQATGQELHGKAEDPLFTDINNGDLTLQSSSPCIDAGVVIKGINEDYEGSAPDMGAFEGASGPVPPVAEFSGNPTSGPPTLTVYFTDLSSGSPTSWDWTFGDGGTSTAQHPSHDYTSENSYTVSLTAYNAQGQDTETKIDYITVVDQSCHVGAIDLVGKYKSTGPPSGRGYYAEATVTVHDQSCAVLSGVTVDITWSGCVSGTDSGVTDDNGQVVFESPTKQDGGTFQCCVDDLTKSGYPYQSGDNHETCDNIVNP